MESHGLCRLDQAIWPEQQGMMSVKFRPDEIDVAVFQRHFSLEQQNEVFRQLLSRRIPIVFDIDDDFLNVPPDHTHADTLLKIRPNVLKLLSMADCVTVTTEELQKLYAPYCRRTEIIRNTLSPSLWSNPCRWTAAGPLIVGYTGSATHEGDLKMIEPMLMEFLETHSGSVELHLWGCTTEGLKAHPHVRFREAFKGDYHDYVRSIQLEPMDIGLAPLEPHSFNRAKSALKWKEYAAGSVPSILSRIPAYERVVEDGVTGFICDTPGQWRMALDKLVADAALRRRVGEEARRRMTGEYSLEKAVTRWGEVLRSVSRESPKTRRPGPFTSIIIPVFNRCDLTEKCLDAVFKNTQGLFEVLVVDNASSDGTGALLDRWKGKIHDIRNRTNLGFAAANNQAALQAVGDMLVMLNNDTEVRPGWLEALIRCQAETGASLVGSRLYYPDGSIQHAGVAFYPHDKKPHALYPGLPPSHSDFEFLTGRRREFQCVTAACWLVTEKAWKEVGGFDEGFINGYEDVDFCLRLIEKGGRIFYEPGCQVTHHESQSPGRGQHSAGNEQRLFERWRSKWVEDLPYYLADDRLTFDPASGYRPCGGPFESNIRALATHHALLADKALQFRGGFARRRIDYISEGPSVRIHHKGGAALLHSLRDPRREAEKLAEQVLGKQQGKSEIRLFGFGLGFLAESVLARLDSSGRLIIRIEDMLVFRLALENRDLAGLLADPRVTFDSQLDPAGAFWLPALLQLKA